MSTKAKYRIVPTEYYHLSYRVQERKLFWWKNLNCLLTLEGAEAYINKLVNPIHYDKKGNRI